MKNQPTLTWRQGDVILTQIPESLAKELEEGFRPEWTELPFEHTGETGKKHQVGGKDVKRSKGQVRVRTSGRGRRASRPGTIIKAPKGAEIRHPDHPPIKIPPGTYVASPERDMRGIGAGGD